MNSEERYLRYADGLPLMRPGTIVITGGNSGVGFETASYLARLQWRVILAVRNSSRGEKAKEEILLRYPEAKIEVFLLDVSQPKSIDDFVSKVREEKLDIDVFYCNAGIYRVPFHQNEMGFESTMMTNFVGNYLLYEKLKHYLYSLKHEVRFVLTSSIVARFMRYENDDLYGENYHPMRAYRKSKVAVNQLYQYICDECKGTNILPLLVHPGITYTPLIAKAYKGKKFQLAAQRFLRLFFHKPSKAALSTLYLLQNNVSSPSFCGPRGLFHTSGYPKIYRLNRSNLKGYRDNIEYLKNKLKESNVL